MTGARIWRWLLLIAVDTGAQIAFKIAGSTLEVDHGVLATLRQAIQSPWVFSAFALYLATFFVWMTILREDDLSRVFPMTAIMSVTTVAAGVALFHESLSLTGLFGIGCIVMGVTLLARDRLDTRPTSSPTQT
jgi:drug/metabolite transporter (DMT)-like permease